MKKKIYEVLRCAKRYHQIFFEEYSPIIYNVRHMEKESKY